MSLVKRIQKLLQGRDGVFETPDPTPVEVPIRFSRPLSDFDHIRNVQRATMESMSRFAASQGAETFEESEDFDVDDDLDFDSPYETQFDPMSGREMYRQEKQFLDEQRRVFDEGLREAKNAKKARGSSRSDDKNLAVGKAHGTLFRQLRRVSDAQIFGRR